MMTLPVRGYTLPSAIRSATEPRSYTLSRDVLIPGHQPVVPQAGGVYDISAPVNEKAYFKVRGVRQWNTDTAPSGGGVPTGMKAKYDLLVRANEDVERNRACPAKIYTIQQQDSVLLGEQILRRAAFREMQTYDDLVSQGLTHEEATKVIRDQMIAKAVIGKGNSTRAYHQQLKEVVHQMAAERGVQVGLPQSLATFAGKFAPHAHFATTGVGAVKAKLRQKIHDPIFNVSKTAAQLEQERIVQAAAGVRQVPAGNSLPPADAFAELPRMAMQMRVRSRSESIAEAAGVGEGRQGAFDPSMNYDLDSLRRRAREMGVSASGTAAQLVARLNERIGGGGGEIAQPIAEGQTTRKLKK
jgi:hypothetical protein